MGKNHFPGGRLPPHGPQKNIDTVFPLSMALMTTRYTFADLPSNVRVEYGHRSPDIIVPGAILPVVASLGLMWINRLPWP